MLAAGVAWAGLVAGHGIGYLLAYPGDGERATRLADTGHGSFGLLTLLALAMVPAILGGLAVRALRDRSDGWLRGVWPRLAVAQSLGFLLLEWAERGFSLPATAADRAVWLGLAVQVVVAAASAVLLRGLVRTVRAVAARIGRHRWSRRVRVRPGIPVTPQPWAARFLVRARRRAPPLPSAA